MEQSQEARRHGSTHAVVIDASPKVSYYIAVGFGLGPPLKAPLPLQGPREDGNDRCNVQGERMTSSSRKLSSRKGSCTSYEELYLSSWGSGPGCDRLARATDSLVLPPFSESQLTREGGQAIPCASKGLR